MKHSLDPDRYKPRPPYDWDRDPDPGDQWNAPMTHAETAFIRGVVIGAAAGAVATLLLVALFWWLR